jgi:Predicted membrane protein
MHWFLDPITKHYVDFSGRATRKQYWMYVLYTFLIFFGIGLVLGIAGLQDLAPLLQLAQLAIFLPGLAISVRRLHDIGESGWWLLIALIPFVGAILLLILYATKGDAGPNAYGMPVGQGAAVADGDTAPLTPPTPPAPPAA